MDSIQAQLQIRQNALEAQDYVQDLMSWQQNLKSSQTKAASSKQQHPQLPVRGRAAGSVAAAPKEAQQPRSLQPPTSSQQQQNKESRPAAHTYKNYDKWDKFDVDAALQAADTASSSKAAQPRPAAVPTSRDQQQQQQPPMMEPRVANAPAAAQSPSSKAAALKDQGNRLFQARYYEDAISCYTQSIDALPTAVAYANRAMALLKLEKYTEAAADCSAALQLDPIYVKAWHRRATARKQLGQLLDAAADYEEALRLEPSNASLQADRNQALDQHLRQQQLQRSNQWHSIPVQLLSEAPPQQQQQQQHQQQPQQQGLEGQQLPAGSPSQARQQLLAKPQIQPQQQQQLLPQDQATPAAATVNGTARPVTPTGTNSNSSRGSSAQASPQQRQAVSAAAQAAAQQLAARLASSLKAPKTGHEFESAWRSLKGDVQLQGKYLRLLQPQQLPALFKSSLTAQLVNSLLTAALTAAAQLPPSSAEDASIESQQQQQQQEQGLPAAHAVGLVEGLVGVPRFGMMAMSLSSRDKVALKQLWDAAAAAVDSDLQGRLAAVRPQYRL